jgi:hypothetical protein
VLRSVVVGIEFPISWIGSGIGYAKKMQLLFGPDNGSFTGGHEGGW